jgi:hypothetical protein
MLSALLITFKGFEFKVPCGLQQPATSMSRMMKDGFSFALQTSAAFVA